MRDKNLFSPNSLIPSGELQAVTHTADQLRLMVLQQQRLIDELARNRKDTSPAETVLAGLEARLSSVETKRKRMRGDGEAFKARQPKRYG